uniref:Angiopoietin-related protein 2-like n=1 Tax=Sinocyclocheilus grahami TaxID=75366 RepID=A0A672MPN7_SINGR
MEIPVTCAVVFLLVFGGACCVDGHQEEASNADTSKGDAGQKRPPRATENKPSRCSYTFIVPQQKLTGALCVSTETARVNRSEMASLRALLDRQQEQLDTMRGQLEQEGAQANEMRVLRRESVNMNARITQLYAQLLNEIIQKKDQALEQRRLESLVLNATGERQHERPHHLEKKYDALTSLVSNQSQLITHLEKQCQLKNPTKAPQVITSVMYSVPLDQSAPLHQEQSPPELLETFDGLPSLPTDTPFTSYPVTKSPGSIKTPKGPWNDCHHVLESGEKTSGIYLLRPRNTNTLLQAWCDQSRAQGGWTVIQRRQDGSVNFFRTWEQYKQGFGNLDGEYWLGLEHLHWLTSQATYKLRVAMEDWQGRQAFAEYDSFQVEPESDWYRLRLGSYQGNAGDSLSWHNNKAFTTLDRDKDAYSGNCAHYQKGGWWYHMCAHSNLNGVWYRGGHYRSRYQDGVYWAELHGGSYSLKKVAMMIKPA